MAINMENNMEKPNVNNLNGIPNFGYGFEEEVVETVPTEEVVASLDEVADDADTEVKPKKKK